MEGDNFEFTLMPLGDSLTVGVFSGSPPEEGYRSFLLDKFEESDLSVKFVGSRGSEPLKHEGRPGRTIKGINDLVVDQTTMQSPWTFFDPEAILLMAGTNNLRSFRNDGSDEMRRTDAESSAEDLDKLINDIQLETPGDEKIFVASIPYINVFGSFYEGGDLNSDNKVDDKDQKIINDEVDLYNTEVQNIANNSEDVHFVDINQLLKGGELSITDFPDGVHPTKSSNAYSRFADVWFESIFDNGIIEAEDLELVNYRVEDNDFASNGELISLRGAGTHTGSASTTFTGREGLYDIVVGYFDENDGNARFSFEVDGVPVDNWIADQDLGSGAPNEKTFTRRTIGGVELETGDELTIVGTRDGSDFARVDFFNLLPRSVFDVDSDPITAVPETETII